MNGVYFFSVNFLKRTILLHLCLYFRCLCLSSFHNLYQAKFLFWHHQSLQQTFMEGFNSVYSLQFNFIVRDFCIG